MRLYHCALTAFLSASALVAVGALAACGGSAPPPVTPTAGGDAVTDAGAPEPTTTTTTTLTLSDGGDLTGSKLETKTTTVVPASSTAPTTQGASDKSGHKGERGRTVEDIRVIVGTRRDEIRACYDKSLRDHPGIEGDVDVKWLVDPKGNVTEVTFDEMKSTISEPGVRKCIGDVIKSIKFAESEKGLESRMHYPFNFNPRSGGKMGAPETGKKK